MSNYTLITTFLGNINIDLLDDQNTTKNPINN